MKCHTRWDQNLWWNAPMRVPIQKCFHGEEAKGFSFVAEVPYAPIDIDLGHLARGEWNAARALV